MANPTNGARIATSRIPTIVVLVEEDNFNGRLLASTAGPGNVVPSAATALVDRYGSTFRYTAEATVPDASTELPLDLMLCVDLSSSFFDDLTRLRQLIQPLFAQVVQGFREAQFGLSSFMDIPQLLPPADQQRLGMTYYTVDYPYRLHVPLVANQYTVSTSMSPELSAN